MVQPPMRPKSYTNFHEKGRLPGRETPLSSGKARSARRALKLRGQVAGLTRVERDARAHRGAQGALLDVAPLRGRRLEPQDLLQRRGVVLHELHLVEGRLADVEVEVAVPVDQG